MINDSCQKVQEEDPPVNTFPVQQVVVLLQIVLLHLTALCVIKGFTCLSPVNTPNSSSHTLAAELGEKNHFCQCNLYKFKINRWFFISWMTPGKLPSESCEEQA